MGVFCKSGMTVIHAEAIQEGGIGPVIDRVRRLSGNAAVYLSFNIDSLDPAFAPGTGTPEIGDLTTGKVQALLRGLDGINIIGGDVVEVSPI